MIRVCYCCKAALGEIAPLEDRRITHGLCDACYEKEIAEVRRITNRLRTKITTDGGCDEPIRH